MKKILFAIALAFSFYAQAQNQVIEESFWKTNPSLEQVKTAIKQFDYANVQGSKDPILLAIKAKAPIETIQFLIDQPQVNFSRTIHEGRNYLHDQTNANNLEVVDYLLQKGADMYFIDANGQTPLTFAAFSGKLTKEMLDIYIKHGLDVKKRYEKKDNVNLLLLAVGYDNGLAFTKYLETKGLSIKDIDDKGYNAFYHAVKIGNVEVLKQIVNAGVKPTNDALFAAAMATYKSSPKVDVFQYLIEDLKLDPKIVDDNGQNLLHYVAKKKDQDEVVNYLLAKGVDAKKVDNAGNTPFFIAASGISLNVVKALQPFVKDINQQDKDGNTALSKAVATSTGEVVEFLISKGADVNYKDKNGNNLAFVLVNAYKVPRFMPNPNAAPQKDEFSLKLNALKQNKVDFSKPFKNGQTVYHLAAEKNDINLFKKLSDVKANVNQQDNEGFTAMHKAALVAKDDQVLKYLLTIGANPKLKSNFDETVYDLASDNEVLKQTNISIEFLK